MEYLETNHLQNLKILQTSFRINPNLRSLTEIFKDLAQLDHISLSELNQHNKITKAQNNKVDHH